MADTIQTKYYVGKTDVLYIFNLIKTLLDDYAKAADVPDAQIQADWDQVNTTALDYIKNKPTIPTVDTVLSDTSANAISNAAVASALNDKAPTASPTFTGTVTVPTAADGDDSTTAASTAFVVKAIGDALKGITGISIDATHTSYADLVANGSKKTGVIYLVPNDGSVPNASDEYFWNGTSYELFGTTAIDLSDYVTIAAFNSNIQEITTDEIQAAWDSVFPS